MIEVPESQIDALSTISGSGPAYVFYLIRGLTRTAVGLGFTPQQAELMVQGTFLGASELLAASGKSPEERRQVTSPNGTTMRAVAELESSRPQEHIRSRDRRRPRPCAGDGRRQVARRSGSRTARCRRSCR